MVVRFGFVELILPSYRLNLRVRCLRSMRTFSGIQPTGTVHLGNYLGAIRSWGATVRSTSPSNRMDNFFCIVDLHAITMPKKPSELRDNIFRMAASLLACGLDPERCVLFQQSSVGGRVSELCWILTCVCTVSTLSRMSQYKEKSSNLKEIPLGLFMYPVLQSADILLYKGTHVPVGEDNLQHVEMSRKLARSFNNRFCSPDEPPLFPVPKPVLVEETQRVRSLRKPTKKMSKSDQDSRSCIYIDDSPEDVVEKLKKAVTDSDGRITHDPEKRPGVSNLVSIYASVSGRSVEEICKETEGLDTGNFKLTVAEALNEHLADIREKINYYANHKDHLESILDEGSGEAKSVAEETMAEARRLVGFR